MQSCGRAGCSLRNRIATVMAYLLSCCMVLAAGSIAARAETGGEPESGWPETARREIVGELLEDMRAEHDASDGGGAASLLSEPVAHAGRRGTWKIQYQAGPLGVAAGGSVQLQVSPFWGWSDPQNADPAVPGYTTVTTARAGTRLTVHPCGQGCLEARIEGAALRPGDRILFAYGAGQGTAIADRYAEHGERFRIWVDGDGDGTRRLIAHNPVVTVKAAPAAQLVATLPSTAGVGEEIPLILAFLDARANAAPSFVGEVTVDTPTGISFPAKVEFQTGDDGHKRIQGTAAEPGIYRLRVKAPGGMSRITNPIEVTEGNPRRIRWADLQGHTNLSDGSGSLDDYYIYARDFAGLDAAAATDHDHWGLGFLDQRASWWAAVQAAADRYYAPGRFVSITGYEWTSWIYGHRHVLYFSRPATLFSSLDPKTDTPAKLWKALRAAGAAAVTVPHHPGGGPVAIDWSFPPDPLLEPLVEVVSVHGSSECARAAGLIYRPEPGHFVCDALSRGYRLGMIGSGDGHDGHPGMSHLGAPSGGLAAIIGAELTRKGVLAALRSRRVYGTNGERMIVEFRLGAHPMGSAVKAGRRPPAEAYHGRVVGTSPITVLEIVKNGKVVASVAGDGQLTASLAYRDPARKAGDYAYLRAAQRGGGMAWSSPIWTE